MVREFDEGHPIRPGAGVPADARPRATRGERSRVCSVAASIASLIVLGVVRFEAGRRPDAVDPTRDARRRRTPRRRAPNSTRPTPRSAAVARRSSGAPTRMRVGIVRSRTAVARTALGASSSGQTFEPAGQRRSYFHVRRSDCLEAAGPSGNARGASSLVVDGERARLPPGVLGDVVSLELRREQRGGGRSESPTSLVGKRPPSVPGVGRWRRVHDGPQKKSYIQGAGPPNSRSSAPAAAGSTNPNVTASAAESDPL